MSSPELSQAIPLTLLTGFLGAGKTTLLNHLLSHPDMEETAVLINEFGEVGLDHLLMKKIDETTTLLNAGCLCCSIRGDLVEALQDLFLKRVRGDVPDFKRVLVETTGLADPAPILHTLMTEPFLGARYRLDGVATVIDAFHGESQMAQNPEALKQAAVADRLILSKTDLCDEQGLAALQDRLKALNPAAPRLIADQGAVEPHALLNAGLFNPGAKIPDVEGWLRAEAYETPHQDHGHSHDHAAQAHNVNRHGEDIQAHCFTFTAPLPESGFMAAMEMLISTQGENLLRVKGVLFFEDEPDPIAIHGVQHVFHPPRPLPTWPLKGQPTSQLVMIVRGINRQDIEQLFEATCPQLTEQAVGS